MRRKSTTRTRNFRSKGGLHRDRLASFHEQMADFARGETLKELRERRHLSQASAAHEIGVSEKTIRSWEHGGKIQWPNAKKAARFYEVEPESLVSRELATIDGVPPEQLDRIEAKQSLILRVLAEVLAERLEPDLDAEIHNALRASSQPAQDNGELTAEGR